MKSISGLNHSACCYFTAKNLKKGFNLIVVPESEVGRIAEELSFYTHKRILEFPHFQYFSEMDLNLLENKFQRNYTLSILNKSKDEIIVTTIKALMRMVLPPHRLSEYTLYWRAGSIINRTEISEKLTEMGYKRREKVEEPGEFAIRGEIIDIYPPFYSPVRIDLFDDEIEKIYSFDSITQVSIDEISETVIFPLREALASITDLKAFFPCFEEDLLNESEKEFERIFKPGSFFEYLSEDFNVIFFEYDEQIDFILEWETENKAFLKKCNHFFPLEKVISILDKKSSFRLSTFSKDMNSKPSLFQAGTSYRGNIENLIKDLRESIKNSESVLIGARTNNQCERIKDILSKERVVARKIDNFKQIKKGFIHISVCNISEGFIDEAEKFRLITENDIFGARLERFHSKEDESFKSISSFTEIKPGDLIVHVEHGIGRYIGNELMDVAGEKKDMLIIEYAGNDKLYIPVDNILMLQKYIGSAGIILDKLGSKRFSKAKKKAREAAEKFAKELLRLYALRSTKKGYAYSPDTIWQEKMEALFPYRETEDQLKVIYEVKSDMEKQRPMDRLVCGDVGFGKTEVAIRAAFKAAVNGKQVAILAPTTILCLQHHKNFYERMKDFPIKLAVMSRLSAPAYSKEVIKGLEEGKIDIVIGTHKLLQKNIKFRDLGLLIIDEEQRFGVKHKEMLKKFKETVDTLTLTATPIPRTLNLSLSGLKNISMITTPPPNRQAVETFVMKKDYMIIKSAIERELTRNGQVFIVHNRVQTIYGFAEEIQKLIPKARIRVGHGQIPKSELEALLLDFWEYKFDILISTTIIESGIDFPNANTLIVDDANKFGLAQLYQLRGRIGRSARQAYAYFLYDPVKMTPDSKERLKAIATHTALGSGFKVAMQDLEIRGAGNILGKQQSGHIESVGFEMYTNMLREETAKIKGEKIEKPREVKINLRLSAYIPEEYISDDKQKIEIYKKIAEVSSFSSLDRVMKECIDRFGKIPFPVKMLFKTIEIKCFCYALYIKEIRLEGQVLRFEFYSDAKINLENLKKMLEYDRYAQFVPGEKAALIYKIKGKNKSAIIDTVMDILRELS